MLLIKLILLVLQSKTFLHEGGFDHELLLILAVSEVHALDLRQLQRRISIHTLIIYNSLINLLIKSLDVFHFLERLQITCHLEALINLSFDYLIAKGVAGFVV